MPVTALLVSLAILALFFVVSDMLTCGAKIIRILLSIAVIIVLLRFFLHLL